APPHNRGVPAAISESARWRQSLKCKEFYGAREHIVLRNRTGSTVNCLLLESNHAKRDVHGLCAHLPLEVHLCGVELPSLLSSSNRFYFWCIGSSMSHGPTSGVLEI